MNTKLIAALMIALVMWGGYRLFVYYTKVDAERYSHNQENTGKNLDPTRLPGLPYQLEPSLAEARKHGAAALGKWLATYGAEVGDPRKAWIQLDYCQMVFREKPQEARSVFASVKDRVHEGSPVYPRVKELEKSFE